MASKIIHYDKVRPDSRYWICHPLPLIPGNSSMTPLNVDIMRIYSKRSTEA